MALTLEQQNQITAAKANIEALQAKKIQLIQAANADIAVLNDQIQARNNQLAADLLLVDQQIKTEQDKIDALAQYV